jgi:hypothetical protein
MAACGVGHGIAGPPTNRAIGPRIKSSRVPDNQDSPEDFDNSQLNPEPDMRAPLETGVMGPAPHRPCRGRQSTSQGRPLKFGKLMRRTAARGSGRCSLLLAGRISGVKDRTAIRRLTLDISKMDAAQSALNPEQVPGSTSPMSRSPVMCGQASAESKRLLVVEDDAQIRQALATMLRSEDYWVDVCDNGLRALERLRAGIAPDAIVLV